jgi:hypothetical protein
MQSTPDSKIALVALIALAAWLFIGLPVLYLPHEVQSHGEMLGVKYGEWLLFLATMALFWATWRLVVGAEETAERQLRAYVHISAARALPRGDRIDYYIEAKNYGQTPAYDVRLRYIIALRDFPPAEPFSYPDGPLVSSAVLPPDTPMHDAFTPDQVLGPNQKRRFLAGEVAIYVFGIITYVDIFRRRRTTEFRYMCGGNVGLDSKGALRICEEGNSAT